MKLSALLTIAILSVTSGFVTTYAEEPPVADAKPEETKAEDSKPSDDKIKENIKKLIAEKKYPERNLKDAKIRPEKKGEVLNLNLEGADLTFAGLKKAVLKSDADLEGADTKGMHNDSKKKK